MLGLAGGTKNAAENQGSGADEINGVSDPRPVEGNTMQTKHEVSPKQGWLQAFDKSGECHDYWRGQLLLFCSHMVTSRNNSGQKATNSEASWPLR